MKIGYAIVSTMNQKLETLPKLVKDVGIELIYQEERTNTPTGQLTFIIFSDFA